MSEGANWCLSVPTDAEWCLSVRSVVCGCLL